MGADAQRVDGLVNGFKKSAKPILAVSAIITLLLLLQLFPNLPEFHTQLSDFAPDSDAVIAEERISQHFDSESRPIFIHVEMDDGSNVLELNNIKEQSQHLININQWAQKNQGFIISNISAPGMIQLALDEEANYTSLADVNDWEDLLELVLDDDVSCTSDRDGQLDSAASFVSSTMLNKDLDLSQTCDWLDDYPVDPTPFASSTLWVIEVDPSLPDDERQIKSALLREEFVEYSDSTDLTYSVASLDLVSHDIDQGTFDNLAILILIAVGVVVAILALAFKTLRGVLFPLSGLLLALIWTYGTLAGFGVQFTALEVAIAPLVLGLGIDYSIHLQRRYETFRSEGMDPAQAWLSSLDRLAAALSFAVITTVAAFLANIFSPLPPIRIFGFGLAFGVVSAFLCSTVVVGCLHVVLDRKERDPGHASLLQLPRLSAALVNFQRHQQALVIVVAVLICGASIIGASNLETEFDLSDFLDDEMPIMQVRSELNDSYDAASWKLVYILFEPANGKEVIADDTELLYQLNRLDDRLGHTNGVVGWEDGNPSYEGPFVVLRDAVLRDSVWGSNHNLEIRNDELVEINSSLEMDIAGAFSNLSQNSSVADPLSGKTWSQRVSSVTHLDNGEIVHMRMEVRVIAATSADSSAILESFETQLGSTDSPGTLREGLSQHAIVHLGGDLVKLQIVLEGLTTSQVESTVISLVVSFFVLLVLTRKVVPAMLVLLPVAVASLWVVGSMVLFGLEWNVLTVMVTALTIGIGIDYSIHIWRRFETELQLNPDKPWEALHVVISTTGVALMLSAGTTVCGFLVLLMSPMPLVQDFGLVTALTVVFSLLLAVIFLPILLVLTVVLNDPNGNGESAEMDNSVSH
ncbi:MAG: MMPL family transporter [Euryarchaeota archaeon]|nr:MMPL family transporter [Euryarchaeota archaeon]MBT3970919.1 MMPL family transporter [Euryarchaeota archaeon]MBT4406894.1 MMPL family transporter [Euryarchaeota archaeon]